MELKDLITTIVQNHDGHEMGLEELSRLESLIKEDIEHIFGIDSRDPRQDQFLKLIFRTLMWLEYKNQEQLSLLRSSFDG